LERETGAAATPKSSDSTSDAERFALLDDLARARQRLGDFAQAVHLWDRARREAEAAGDGALAASALRRIGLAHFRTGRQAEALEAFGSALAAAGEGARALGVRTRIVRGVCLHAVGRVEDARLATRL
jgi:tetratricopeptide (TPR) repeat protein